jgi:RNA polymerase sigma factor (sigma-70 family)
MNVLQVIPRPTADGAHFRQFHAGPHPSSRPGGKKPVTAPAADGPQLELSGDRASWVRGVANASLVGRISKSACLSRRRISKSACLSIRRIWKSALQEKTLRTGALTPTDATHAGPPLQTVVRHLRRLAGPDGDGAPADAQLLGRFVATGDPAALELLVWRHGAMVLGVCRRVLRHEQDAEDAFQATFLALARKARSVARRASVGGWLYTVAYRAALAARERASRRSGREVPLNGWDAPAPANDTAEWRDLRAVLDEEIGRLPERHRLSFVLCHLEGRTLDEAARQLGRPRGTIVTWLARARARLRARLAGRGITLVAAGFSGMAAADATAGPPVGLVTATLRAVAGGTAVSGSVLTLTEGVIRTMFLSQLKATATVVLATVVIGAGVSGVAVQTYAADDPPAAQAVPKSGSVRPAHGESVIRPRTTLGGWGDVIDPDGDCSFEIAREKLTIKLPGRDHALGVERDRMNAPRVLRDVEGDVIAQVKVSGEFPTGAKSVVEDRRPFHGAGLLLWQDAKTYVRLERAVLVADDQNHAYVSWELRKNGEFARAGHTGDHLLPVRDPVWLRLERRGGKVHGSVSTDGNRWTPLEPIQVDLAKTLRVGVVAGHNTGTGFAPTFEGFQVFQALGR